MNLDDVVRIVAGKFTGKKAIVVREYNVKHINTNKKDVTVICLKLMETGTNMVMKKEFVEMIKS